MHSVSIIIFTFIGLCGYSSANFNSLYILIAFEE